MTMEQMIAYENYKIETMALIIESILRPYEIKAEPVEVNEFESEADDQEPKAD